jgi:hypothetical protein
VIENCGLLIADCRLTRLLIAGLLIADCGLGLRIAAVAQGFSPA